MKIVFATNNAHKLDEIRKILGTDFELLSLHDIGCDEDIAETGSTLNENALIKAQYIFDKYHYDVFADDTGLEVEALNGEPGVYSARYAGGEEHDSEANMTKLMAKMEGTDNRKARFRTVICLIQNRVQEGQDRSTNFFEGIVEGNIIRERRGGEGFGYDPIFEPEGYQQTFAELGNDIKNGISHRARAVKKLAAYLKQTLVMLLLLLGMGNTALAAVGDWHNYLAYSDPQQIEEVDHYLFVKASDHLYLYNKNDQSITTFDKTNGLNDVTITKIAWNKTAKRLVIAYDNANIDLMDIQGNVTNIRELYDKSMTEDKTINGITISGRYAYIATNFGALKLDMANACIMETYMLDKKVKKIGVDNTAIYAQTTSNQVYTASLKDNLIDKSNWTLTSNYPSQIFNEDLTAYTNNIELVKTLEPGGPKYTDMGCIKFYNDTLYSCQGTFGVRKEAYVQTFCNGEWRVYPSKGITDQTGVRYECHICLDVKKIGGKTIVYAGGRNGLYQYTDGQFTGFWNHTNSPIRQFDKVTTEYELVTALTMDNSSNVYLFNGYSYEGSLMMMNAQGQWASLDDEQFKYSSGQALYNVRNMIMDSRGYLWFGNDHWQGNSFYCYDVKNKKVLHAVSHFVNQDGTDMGTPWVTSTVEDRQNNIWVTTSLGAILLNSSEIGTSSLQLNQVKVPRNDGTNLADYLMANIDIETMAVDGGNRKWFGTQGNGVMVVSNDNMQQDFHFTTDNSPLLSNMISSISINPKTGEVFISTDKGLCSYMSESTSPAEDQENNEVYAYPNPVTPEYEGTIAVVGLSFNSDVKILSTNGHVVAEGRSSGGSFTWNGRDKNGKRVASGVYMVVTAKEDGSKGTVCKIAVIN